MIKAHTSNSKENQSQSASATNSEVQSSEESKSEFVDNRPQTIAQRKLQGSANNSPKGNISSQMQNGGESTFQFVDNRPQTIAQRKLQGIANNSPLAKGVVQLQPTTVLQRNPSEDFKKSKKGQKKYGAKSNATGGVADASNTVNQADKAVTGDYEGESISGPTAEIAGFFNQALESMQKFEKNAKEGATPSSVATFANEGMRLFAKGYYLMKKFDVAKKLPVIEVLGHAADAANDAAAAWNSNKLKAAVLEFMNKLIEQRGSERNPADSFRNSNKGQEKYKDAEQPNRGTPIDAFKATEKGAWKYSPQLTELYNSGIYSRNENAINFALNVAQAIAKADPRVGSAVESSLSLAKSSVNLIQSAAKAMKEGLKYYHGELSTNSNGPEGSGESKENSEEKVKEQLIKRVPKTSFLQGFIDAAFGNKPDIHTSKQLIDSLIEDQMNDWESNLKIYRKSAPDNFPSNDDASPSKEKFKEQLSKYWQGLIS